MVDNPLHYHIHVFLSAEDESWIADIPDLRFCSVHFDTPDEASNEVQVAIAAWLVHYNRERPHLGYRNQGRRPWETIQRFVTQEG